MKSFTIIILFFILPALSGHTQLYQVCPEPADLSLSWEENNQQSYTLYFDWSHPDTLHWMRYHDGSFEGAMCSNEGGAGLSQLFFPESYPCYVGGAAYFNTNNVYYWAEEQVYVVNASGTEILAGPISFSNSGPNEWVRLSFTEIEIMEGNFMINTINPVAHGPFIGMDEDHPSQSLYFGYPGAYSPLHAFGFEAVGSHEARIRYPGGCSRYFPAGYNLYHETEGRVNPDLIPGTWFTLTDFNPLLGLNCFYVEAVYDTCVSLPSNSVCLDVNTQTPVLTKAAPAIVFPNPARDHIFVRGTDPVKQVKIYDTRGNLILHLDNPGNDPLSVSSLPRGLYICHICFEKKIAMHKIILQ